MLESQTVWRSCERHAERYFDFFSDRSALVGLELAGEAQKLDFVGGTTLRT